jgi:hypothetical protein
MQPTVLRGWVDARPLLLESVPWSPLDFIRGLSVEGDRAVQFEALTRDIDDVNDLRIVSPIGGSSEVAVFAERLPWDSAFFGYDVARLNGVFPMRRGGYSPDADYTPALRSLIRVAEERRIRYLFAVVDARDLPTFRALTALGFTFIETRLYHYLALRNYDYPRRFGARMARPSDVEALVETLQSVENPYDRFNSDPFIGHDHARRLIAAWIRASIVERFADATLIPDAARPSSLITAKYHHDKAAAWDAAVAQIVLALAAPGAENRFVGVVSELHYHLRDRGTEHVLFTTQITNRATLRIAQHFGYKFGRGEYVFRLLL